jgi:hypothetical protein
VATLSDAAPLAARKWNALSADKRQGPIGAPLNPGPPTSLVPTEGWGDAAVINRAAEARQSAQLFPRYEHPFSRFRNPHPRHLHGPFFVVTIFVSRDHQAALWTSSINTSAVMFSAARTASVQPSGWAAISSSARRRGLGERLCRVLFILGASS